MHDLMTEIIRIMAEGHEVSFRPSSVERPDEGIIIRVVQRIGDSPIAMGCERIVTPELDFMVELTECAANLREARKKGEGLLNDIMRKG